MNAEWHITNLCKIAHENSKSKGFWNDRWYTEEAGCEVQFKLARFALIASEVGEAVEAVRKDDSENLAEELADICIRIFDYCGGFKINLGKAIIDKMEKNTARPYMHGKNS